VDAGEVTATVLVSILGGGGLLKLYQAWQDGRTQVATQQRADRDDEREWESKLRWELREDIRRRDERIEHLLSAQAATQDELHHMSRLATTEQDARERAERRAAELDQELSSERARNEALKLSLRELRSVDARILREVLDRHLAERTAPPSTMDSAPYPSGPLGPDTLPPESGEGET
jgi:chromosome segregation ATPase